ncbi:multidrug efflux SMR transporter [Terribacillus sp. DMT04]|uniref:DMT family transporter n=1 Tax=Terribacillus sp. DMT04 TaxID=2850441 RepID=UPI001C2BC3B0|nr:multidrug efflux SMR transporter [Terribacillus sp. DMT04]QXE02876.1 multidrug efflux SMR transporter [Terribacillus sp. DMT04]
MAWIVLIIAGLFEVFGVTMINKLNEKPTAANIGLFILGFAGSFGCLSYSMAYLPMGTAYAIWTGIGTAGGAIVGMLFFRESKDWKRIVCIAMILAAAIGLKLIA